MKRSRFTEEQTIAILRQAAAGVRIVDLCRQNGISDATFYNWRIRWDERFRCDAKRLRQLEDDDAPEFSGKALDARAFEHSVQIVFTLPGKPTDNGHIESFNGNSGMSV